MEKKERAKEHTKRESPTTKEMYLGLCAKEIEIFRSSENLFEALASLPAQCSSRSRKIVLQSLV